MHCQLFALITRHFVLWLGIMAMIFTACHREPELQSTNNSTDEGKNATTKETRCQANQILKDGKCHSTDTASPIQKDKNPKPTTPPATSRTPATPEPQQQVPKLQWMGRAANNSFTIRVDTSSIKELIADLPNDRYTKISFELSGGWQIAEITEGENKKPRLKTIPTFGTYSQGEGDTLTEVLLLKGCKPKKNTPVKTTGATISVNARGELVIDFGDNYWTTKSSSGNVSITDGRVAHILEDDSTSALKYYDKKLRAENVLEQWPKPTASAGITSATVNTEFHKGCFKYLFADRSSDYSALLSGDRYTPGIVVGEHRGKQASMLPPKDATGRPLPSSAYISAADDQEANYKLEIIYTDNGRETVLATLSDETLKYFFSRLYRPYAAYFSGDTNEAAFITKIELMINRIHRDLRN